MPDRMGRSSIPDLERTPTHEPEVKKPGKPEPELKRPRKPEPEIEVPVTPDKPEVGDDQGDSGPDRDTPITQHSKQPTDREDAHIGATEDQVLDTTTPAGDAFKDEPRQG